MSDNWHILLQYYCILQLLKSATIKLQDKIKHHNYIWKVLSTLQQLLEHFELIKHTYIINNIFSVTIVYLETKKLK